jgi:low temperature requirement protein LtrA
MRPVPPITTIFITNLSVERIHLQDHATRSVRDSGPAVTNAAASAVLSTMPSPVRIRMAARSIDEPHRTASPLELLFDLTFVIAVAALTSRFAHAIADGHALDALAGFLQVFFAVWWAWMNYTWFASSFDSDDVPFRLLTLIQMGGVLVLAAGVPAALDHGDWFAVTIGYVVMRLALVAQWLRVALEDPPSRPTALRYALGITLLEIAWIVRLQVDATGLLDDTALLACFVALAGCELAVPFWAERRRVGSWHPHHIAERHGLFAIILLGEGVLAASIGVDRALAASGVSASLIAIAAAACLLVFALWWLYFLHPAGAGLAAHRDRSYLWGYGHYGLFAALAVLGAGLEFAVEQAGHHVAASPVAIGYAIAIPVAVFLVSLWALHASICSTLEPGPVFGSAAVVLAVPLTPAPVATVVAIAAVCSALVALTLRPQRRRTALGFYGTTRRPRLPSRRTPPRARRSGCE